MTLDADIQYVGIYHNHLGNVDAELREDIASYFSDKEHVESATGTKLQMISMRAEKQPHQFQYAMAKFSDTILYAFSINEHDLLLVTTAPTANSDLIISRILDFLRH
jgi:hypothetical protein